jgi:hypothetical protein
MAKVAITLLLFASAYLIDAHWYHGAYFRAAKSVAGQLWRHLLG